MDIEITLKNYRCFPDSKPAPFTLKKGFTGFVGVNNSGKSSLLKFFYEFRSLFQILSSNIGNLISALGNNPQAFDLPRSVFDVNELFCNNNERNLEIQIRITPEGSETETHPLPIVTRAVFKVPRGTNTWLAELYTEEGRFHDDRGFGFEAPILRRGTDNQAADLSFLFQACKSLAEILYIGPFRNAINLGTNQEYFDIQVGQSFIQHWRSLKEGDVKRLNEATFELTEDIKHIFGFETLEINPSRDDQTLQFYINGKSYKLTELGSGITQFIVVLANAATKRPSYILIDEPELNLHPSLQLDFLTTLGSYAQEGVVFGTHSLGLARASADHIYSLSKIKEGESEIKIFEDTPRLSEFLGELSFSGYRELGFNKLLLVEGANDIKTIQQFLRKRKKDHEIVILPLGGSTLINGRREAELEEVMRISENVHALIDSEKENPEATVSPDRQAFSDVCTRVGISCHMLERRAIENYLTDRAVKKVKGEKYQALEPYALLASVSPTWSKEEDWRIAREMELEELNGTDLGTFLEPL